MLQADIHVVRRSAIGDLRSVIFDRPRHPLLLGKSTLKPPWMKVFCVYKLTFTGIE